MRTAILGGAFNPPHYGHIGMGLTAFRDLGFERTLYIPSCVSAHKENSGDATNEDRLAMVYLAIEGIPGAEVSDCEISRGGVSFTIETVVEFLRNGFLDEKPGLLIGSDLSSDFHCWKEAERLAELCDIYLFTRQEKGKNAFPYKHRRVHFDKNIASREIRSALKNDLSVSELMPDKVIDYIRRRGLYGVSRVC